VDSLKTSEATLNAQAEAHKAKVEDLKKKLAKINEKIRVANAKHEISEIERLRAQKNVRELHDSKERCYEMSLECAKALKNSFTKVGAYSSEQKFICGDLDGVVQWISREVVTPKF
jgi:chromosome segregation ATPase